MTMNASFVTIEAYRDFWDFPRMFLARQNGDLFLFNCEFDEETEDFRDDFKVYLMPAISDAELADAWTRLPEKAIQFCGSVPTESVNFDQTRRSQVDLSALEILNPKDIGDTDQITATIRKSA